MQAMPDRLLSKTPYWFNVFSEQLVFTLQQVHQDWVPTPILPRRCFQTLALRRFWQDGMSWHHLARDEKIQTRGPTASRLNRRGSFLLGAATTVTPVWTEPLGTAPTITPYAVFAEDWVTLFPISFHFQEIEHRRCFQTLALQTVWRNDMSGNCPARDRKFQARVPIASRLNR